MKIPDANEAEIKVGSRRVKLTNLDKIFWKREKLKKRDLLQYYADVSKWLLPHIENRAMVLKRYPHGVDGEFFFMKRAPAPRPDYIRLCTIPHKEAGNVPFAIVSDLATLLWAVNLGCIDLNPWYGRCDDYDRPDYLHFDLDPVSGASFAKVREVALIVRDALEEIGMPTYAKTTGSRGIHVYVPIKRGPIQKEVWTVASEIAHYLAARHPKIITSEYRIAKRARGTVLVDYNQNAWGRTLASIYSVRPRPNAPVSTPVTWKEIEDGVETEDFTIRNVLARLKKVGDLWKPVLPAARNRFDLASLD